MNGETREGLVDEASIDHALRAWWLGLLCAVVVLGVLYAIDAFFD